MDTPEILPIASEIIASPKEPTPEELKTAALAKQKADALALAAELNAKTASRIEELKSYVGKTFKRKMPNEFRNQTFTVVRYEGIATVTVPGTRNRETALAHLFRVEGKNPGIIWTPIARDFLNEFEPIETPIAGATSEII